MYTRAIIKKKQPMMRLPVVALDEQPHVCEQRDDPSGRCQNLGQTPLGALPTVPHPRTHMGQACASDIIAMRQINRCYSLRQFFENSMEIFRILLVRSNGKQVRVRSVAAICADVTKSRERKFWRNFSSGFEPYQCKTTRHPADDTLFIQK